MKITYKEYLKALETIRLYNEQKEQIKKSDQEWWKCFDSVRTRNIIARVLWKLNEFSHEGHRKLSLIEISILITSKNLLETRNCGNKTLEDVADTFKKYGLKLIGYE